MANWKKIPERAVCLNFACSNPDCQDNPVKGIGPEELAEVGVPLCSTCGKGMIIDTLEIDVDDL